MQVYFILLHYSSRRNIVNTPLKQWEKFDYIQGVGHYLCSVLQQPINRLFCKLLECEESKSWFLWKEQIPRDTFPHVHQRDLKFYDKPHKIDILCLTCNSRYWSEFSCLETKSRIICKGSCLICRFLLSCWWTVSHVQ